MYRYVFTITIKDRFVLSSIKCDCSNYIYSGQTCMILLLVHSLLLQTIKNVNLSFPTFLSNSASSPNELTSMFTPSIMSLTYYTANITEVSTDLTNSTNHHLPQGLSISNYCYNFSFFVSELPNCDILKRS